VRGAAGRGSGRVVEVAVMAHPTLSEADAQLRERREALVREHMESENHHDFDATIATFAHPRYELIANGDGEEQVCQLGVAHDPSSLAGRISTLVSHTLTIGRALLRARTDRHRRAPTATGLS
jgi:hypothetical protein